MLFHLPALFGGVDENKSYGCGLPYTEKKPGLLSLSLFLSLRKNRKEHALKKGTGKF